MSAPQGHRPQLDALRAIAVTMVAIYHWHHPTLGGRELPLGFLGVGLFFVLSGYLITTILLNVKSRLADTTGGTGYAIWAFYMRRFLRLMPAYYFYLFTLWMTGLMNDPDGLRWHVLYAGNFRSFKVGWYSEVAHLWSLAVEEQFYLLAPIAVLFLSRRNLKVVMLVVLAAGLVASPMESILPPGAFAGLLVGCLLAFAAANGSRTVDIAGRTWALMAIGWAGLFWFFDPATSDARLGHAVYRLTAYLAMAGLVWASALGFSGSMRTVLEWRPILWMGKISYGLYLWHNLAIYASLQLWPNNLAQWTLARFVVFSACTVAMASLSWFIVERPFLTAKSRFPYVKDIPATPTASTPHHVG